MSIICEKFSELSAKEEIKELHTYYQTVNVYGYPSSWSSTLWVMFNAELIMLVNNYDIMFEIHNSVLRLDVFLVTTNKFFIPVYPLG